MLGIQSYYSRGTQSNEQEVDRAGEFRLCEVSFDTAAPLKYEGNPQNPIPNLTRHVEKIKAEMWFWSWS